MYTESDFTSACYKEIKFNLWNSDESSAIFLNSIVMLQLQWEKQRSGDKEGRFLQIVDIHGGHSQREKKKKKKDFSNYVIRTETLVLGKQIQRNSAIPKVALTERAD